MNLLKPLFPDPHGSLAAGHGWPAPEPVCEIRYPVLRGRVLEVDHAHGLYGALKGVCPALQDIPGLGIHTLRGRPWGDRGELLLGSDAELRLRLPLAHGPEAAGLARFELNVQGRRLLLGNPRLTLLAPFPALRARTVTLHFRDLDHAAAREQLRRHFRERFPWGIVTVLRPRTLRIHGQQILGFEMAVRDLDPRASLALQSEGFGGRRAFGCGLFEPASPAPGMTEWP